MAFHAQLFESLPLAGGCRGEPPAWKHRKPFGNQHHDQAASADCSTTLRTFAITALDEIPNFSISS